MKVTGLTLPKRLLECVYKSSILHCQWVIEPNVISNNALQWVQTTNRQMTEIGYKKPPTATQFRPGQSGNPSGRPRRRPAFRDVLLAELATAMPGTVAEHARSKLQALVRTLVDSAIAGNARAQSVVVGALARIGDADEHEAPTLTPDDREILDAYAGSELERRGTESDGEVELSVCGRRFYARVAQRVNNPPKQWLVASDLFAGVSPQDDHNE